MAIPDDNDEDNSRPDNPLNGAHDQSCSPPVDRSPDDSSPENNQEQALVPCVLIVDDEPSILRLATKIVARGGYPTQITAFGGEAVEMVAREPQAFSLILLDVTLPDMAGEQVYRRIRECAPQLPILVSSGYADNAILQWITDDPQAGFLAKPYHPNDLLNAIKNMIGE